jgi:hypothetical protein
MLVPMLREDESLMDISQLMDRYVAVARANQRSDIARMINTTSRSENAAIGIDGNEKDSFTALCSITTARTNGRWS